MMPTQFSKHASPLVTMTIVELRREKSFLRDKHPHFIFCSFSRIAQEGPEQKGQCDSNMCLPIEPPDERLDGKRYKKNSGPMR